MPSDCTHIANCQMYQLLQLSGTLKAWQARYCKADYAQCARYKLSLLGRPVAQNLMPNGALLRITPSPAPASAPETEAPSPADVQLSGRRQD